MITKNLYFIFLFIVVSVCSQNNRNCIEWEEKLGALSTYDSIIAHDKYFLPKVLEDCKVKILNNIAESLYYKGKKDSVLYYYDKGIKLAESINNEEALILLYASQGGFFINENLLSKAEISLLKSKQYLNKYKNSKYSVEYFGQMSLLKRYKSDIESAFVYSDSAIVSAIKVKDTLNLPNLYNNLGVQYFQNNQYEKAIENLLKAVSLKEKQNVLDIDVSYYVLGNCYNVLNNISTAKKYLEKSLASSKKSGNDYVMSLSYLVIAKQHRINGEANLALKNIDSAEILSKRIKKDYNLAEVKLEKGRIYYYGFEDLKKAENSFNEAYKISKRLNSSNITSQSTELLHKVYLKKKQYKKAKYFLDALEASTNGINDAKNRQSFYSTAGNYYKTIGNDKKALENYLLSFKIYDSLYSTDSNAKIAQLEKQYDTQKKELQITKLNQEKKDQETLTVKAKSRQNLFLIFALIASAILIAGLWVYNKLKKQKKALSLAYNSVSEINGVKNRLFSIIAHDLRGMLVPFQRAGKVLGHHVDKENYDRVKSLSNELQNNSNNLSNMLDNLLNWSLKQMNGYVFKAQELSLKEEFETLISNFEQHSKEKNTNIELIYSKAHTVLFDKGAFHVIFRNLIGNALKYTENGTIKVTFEKEFNTLKCAVIDTGVGMDEAQQQQLFKLEENNSTMGTQGEKGTGIGLNIVYRFVTLLKGKILVSSKLRLGTRFDLSFPILESSKDISDNNSISA